MIIIIIIIIIIITIIIIIIIIIITISYISICCKSRICLPSAVSTPLAVKRLAS